MLSLLCWLSIHRQEDRRQKKQVWTDRTRSEEEALLYKVISLRWCVAIQSRAAINRVAMLLINPCLPSPPVEGKMQEKEERLTNWKLNQFY